MFYKQEKSSFWFSMILIIIALLINFHILHWLIKIQKCKCTNNIQEQQYLKEWFIFLIISNILHLIYLITYGKLYDNDKKIYKFFSIMITIINIIMTIKVLLFITKLRKINCHCGLKTHEDIIYYYSIFELSIMLILILISIISIILFL